MVLMLLSFFTYHCAKNNDSTTAQESHPRPYKMNVPSGFPQPYVNEDNPMTEEGVALGRMLYSDPILSSNGLSCSSCHQRAKAFSTEIFTTKGGEKISVPPHVNLAFNPEFGWNGSFPNLDKLGQADFEPEFFNTNSDSLFSRMNRHPLYPRMFREAFGIDDINSLSYATFKEKIVYAISQYMRTLISSNSKFDLYRQKKAKLTFEEEQGMVIFFSEKGDCFHCHGEPLFTDNQFHNNGLDKTFSGLNRGRFLVTSDPNDLGKFSSPTLRNIELTGPYMHDGRFTSLSEVIDFYNSNVQTSATLDPIMSKPNKRYGLNLTVTEKYWLIAFLKTLTDTTYLEN